MVKLALRRRTSKDPAPTAGQDPDQLDDQASDLGTDLTTDPDPDLGVSPAATPPGRVGGFRTLRLLIRAGHPRLALIVAVGMTIAAALSGREAREVALVFFTVLVGQVILGFHNDLVDRVRDRTHQVPDKPVADGRLDPGTVWFALACGVLLLIPLTVTNGITAGTSYLLVVLVGVLGNVVLRQGLLSWVTWAASYALLPAFLSYGGWGGQSEGDPPRVLMTVLFALLGVGVHLMTSLWGLVPDDAAGWKTLPLRLGRRLGSSKLLVATASYVVVVLVAIALAAAGGGLSQ